MHLTICFAAYEAGRDFIAEWSAGALRAARSSDVTVDFLCAVDGLNGADEVIGPKLPGMKVRFESVNEPGPVSARRTLISTGVTLTSDVLMFSDIDDVLRIGAIDSHLRALSSADFSFGDVLPFPSVDGRSRPTLFADADVPVNLRDWRTLLHRNFVGLSALAIRRNKVPIHLDQIPDYVIAVDWWLATQLLLAGLRGRQADQPVCYYRTHGKNTLSPLDGGGGVARFVSEVDIMLRHYKALPRTREGDECLSRLTGVADTIGALSSQTLEPALAKHYGPGTLWFEGTWGIIGELLEGQGDKPDDVA
ncbi:MAG: hypothetical protein HQ495_12945 [Alphaproteobacteria bacterium]|nr:hypothetical protein [Alphaproteobacteria bacterium]